MALGAAWQLHDDLVAFFLVQERAADGRRGGDEAFVDVGVFRHHELIDDRLAVFQQRDGGSETDLVLRDLVEVHQLDFGDALLQEADARLDEPLPLFRRLVLRVLAQIAEFARALDLAGQLGLQLLVELRDLLLEFLQDPVFHGRNSNRNGTNNRLTWRGWSASRAGRTPSSSASATWRAPRAPRRR